MTGVILMDSELICLPKMGDNGGNRRSVGLNQTKFPWQIGYCVISRGQSIDHTPKLAPALLVTWCFQFISPV